MSISSAVELAKKTDDALYPLAIGREKRNVETFRELIAVRFNDMPRESRYAVMNVNRAGSQNFCAGTPRLYLRDMGQQFNRVRCMSGGISIGCIIGPHRCKQCLTTIGIGLGPNLAITIDQVGYVHVLMLQSG